MTIKYSALDEKMKIFLTLWHETFNSCNTRNQLNSIGVAYFFAALDGSG
ncbi:hypothetical protein QE439_003169 [Pedobacter agri]|nr:hypothetical protein [Pedobacter agri]